MADEKQVQIAVRVPPDLIDRAKELATALAEDPRQMGRVTTTAVYRKALEVGIAHLEAEQRGDS